MRFSPAKAIRRIGAVLLASLWFQTAQAAAPAINVSEICTTCQDVIRCTRDPVSPVPAYPVVVYYLHPHTTWEQVVTIWDYLVRFGKPKQEDTRELTVYEFAAADERPAQIRAQQAAELSAMKMTIEMPGARIDRNSGQWSVSTAPGTAELRTAGSCRLLPVADGFAFLRSMTPPP